MFNLITKEDLLDHIQPFWAEVEEAVKLLDVDAAELTRIDAYITTVIDNFYVRSSDRSLARFEKALGIKPPLDATLEQRRERISSSIRAKGTVTKETIRNVAAAFSGGEVDIIEDFANYSVTVKFVGTFGVPADLTSLTAVLRDTLPAHVAFEYAYTYMTWAQLDSQNHTWDAIDGQIVAWDNVDNGALA